MQFLHPAMWDDHDTDFARWLHPVMSHVALQSYQYRHIGILDMLSISTTSLQCKGVNPYEKHVFFSQNYKQCTATISIDHL